MGPSCFCQRLYLILRATGRFLSRESTCSKSALKHPHVHQSCKQGTRSSGPSFCKCIFVLINSIMLSMKHTHVTMWEKPARPKQTTNHQAKPEKWAVGNKSQECPEGNNVFRAEMREHENLKLSRSPKRKQRGPNSKESNPLWKKRRKRFDSSKFSLFKFSKNTKSSLRRH